MQPQHSAFTFDEFQFRFRRAQKALATLDATACLMMAPEHLYYFGGYDSWVSVNSPQALIFTPGGDSPTLLLRDVDLPLAQETTWVSDLRVYNLVRDSFALCARKILEEKASSTGRVAIELSSYAVPAGLADSLRAENAGIEFVDSTRSFGDIRHQKSVAELVYMKQAASYANLGLAAMIERTATGVSEIKLASAIETAMRQAGSDYWAIPTELASGNRTAGGHATPRHRLIEHGDLIHAEFAGVEQRYHAVAIQTIACGEPKLEARELYDIARASLLAGINAARLGVEVSAVEEASLAPLRAHGLEGAAMMHFGYGVGIAYPPVWLETLQIARGFEFTLQHNMAFVLHSCLELPDEQLGVIQGGTWLLEEGGLHLLAGAGDCPLLVL